MITTSEDFKIAIKSTVRRIKIKVEVLWANLILDSSISISALNENRIFWRSQLYDNAVLSDHKWAHLHSGLKCDGTFYPCPSASEANSNQMGYFSSTFCNPSAIFTGSNIPVLDLEFLYSRRILGIVVAGDTQYNEYPVEFNLKFFSGVTEIFNFDVINNTSIKWYKNFVDYNLINIDRVRLTLTKWSKINSVAKITEFANVYEEEYDGDDVVSCKILEQSELDDNTIPCGNVISKEIELSLQNIFSLFNGNKIYDPYSFDNPDSYLKDYVIKNRRITIFLGIDLPNGSTEYVRMGVYWSDDWAVTNTNTFISTVAKDSMDRLRKINLTFPLVENVSVYDLCSQLLTQLKTEVGMSSFKYIISESLKSYIIPYASFKDKNYMSALKAVVSVCQGKCYMDRYDTLIVTI